MIARPWTTPPPLTAPPFAVTGVPPILVSLLQRRGWITADAIADFLHPRYERLADPMLYRQMGEAVRMIADAVKQQTQITVYGDYDVDGITATAIMVETLTALGANVNWYLPERQSEGYGLNVAAVRRLHAAGTRLLITVDCGTTNVEEIRWAKDHEMTVLVFDHHHEPAILPPADAIINPVFQDETYPDRGQSSGGVAFTAARALTAAIPARQTGKKLPAGWEKWLLDIAAISTVADMVPLTGENRILATFGLKVLRKTRRPGLRALMDVIGTDISQADEYTIGYQIAPRLNAAGRLAHASVALHVLLTKNRQEATRLAGELDRINRERQQLTELATTEALEQVRAQGEQSAYVAFAAHWAPGILGLVAGRLTEHVGRPVVVMTEQGDDIVGSGRSISTVDIMGVFDQGAEHFRRYGGHPGACGFTLITKEQRVLFHEWFQSAAQAHIAPVQQQLPLTLDAEIRLADITNELLEGLERCAPYGTGNGRFRWLLKPVTIERLNTAGAKQQHLRCELQDGQRRAKAIAFRGAGRLNDVREGQAMACVVELSWNTWNGQREPQISILDWQAI